MIDTIS